MILYLDTSALVKLYILEQGSPVVAESLAVAEGVGTSLLTYVETRSALARKNREGGFSPHQYEEALLDFEADWEGFLALAIGPDLVRAAGRLAERHGLHGADAVHLASAAQLRDGAREPVTFLCADRRLTEAAQAEGLDAELVGAEGRP
ncbi:MAG: type II toxin-antitoxin system VapC family toxin [Chloroflexi bacterium]|nr:type II toxin-antitoxin system VapC family toxin [Chloroflexota bacterium]